MASNQLQYARSKNAMMLAPPADLRDLAARVQRIVSRGPTRVTPLGALGSRSLRASSAGRSLADIAERVLAMNLPTPIRAVEIALVAQAMTEAHGNITAAAELLGIHRKVVERLLAKQKAEQRRRGRASTVR